MRTIGGFFGRSMFTPVLEHLSKGVDCMESLRELVKRMMEENFDELKRISQRIAKLEHDADIIKEEIRDSFSKSIFSAVSRSDMLTLIKTQDKISDECEDLAKLMSIRETRFPGELKDIFLELTDKVHDTVMTLKSVEEAIDGGQVDVDKVEEMIKAIHAKEWEVDQIQLKFTKTLFSMEKQIDPVTLFVLKDLCRMIGKIANSAENVGDCIRRIISK